MQLEETTTSNGSLDRAATQVARRYRHIVRLWHQQGPRHVGQRLLRAGVSRLGPPIDVQPFRDADVIAADLSAPPQRELLPLAPGEPMSLNWVMQPPGPGAGGPTTMFRLVRHLEATGNRCRIHIVDPYGGDARYYEHVVRTLAPDVVAEVVDLDDGLPDAHATFATFWATAYPVFNARNRGLPCYLVQDFEPSFYPVGSHSVLAENTYRMGFHAITAGRWLAEKLAEEFGMTTAAFDFGCDTERYHLLPSSTDKPGSRDSIVFYARPETPRRGYEIGLLALEAFAARHPEIKIHVYGQRLGPLRFPYIDHGLCTPDELNAIYNQCFGGLSLSMTNVSLVPHEMLSAGCIPVVNDAHHNRVVLDNDYVVYAPPSPASLAGALSDIVNDPRQAERSAAASASVRSASWDTAGAATEAALRRWLTTA
jgi:glycosyltransferase involved in cell wall biosynthesis